MAPTLYFSIGEMPSFQVHGSERKALLVLSDGSFFVGDALGAERKAVGELVFSTSMTGYQEALTDPSYAGQLLTFAYPLIGNYGVSDEDFESARVHANACIVREACATPVHYRSRRSLHEFLKASDAPGIAGVDTRAIVRKVRSHGVMPAALVQVEAEALENADELNAAVEKLAREAKQFNYSATDYVLKVASKKKAVYGAKGFSKKVVLIDCGAKHSIVRELVRRRMQVIVVPPTALAKEILAEEPAGVVVSNGPGDPATNHYVVKTLKNLLEKLPVFGICLGHQLLGHALGGNTFKLKFGHRGSNQPVVNTETGKAFITAQNHGFAVKNVPPAVATEWFVNANDGTNEGLKHVELPVMSVQYHPEANPGPYDNRYLFDEFVKMLE